MVEHTGQESRQRAKADWTHPRQHGVRGVSEDDKISRHGASGDIGNVPETRLAGDWSQGKIADWSQKNVHLLKIIGFFGN